MSIGCFKDKAANKVNGWDVTIGCPSELHALGKTFGVVKPQSDPPHGADDGHCISGALMKVMLALPLSLVCQVVSAESSFYLLVLRHTGDAVLHANSQRVSQEAALPYVVVDTTAMQCCFHIGPKPGPRKSRVRFNEDTRPLVSEEGTKTFQFAGDISRAATDTGGAVDALAFGLVGMTSVAAKGKRTYEIAMRGSASPVIVRHCLGAEGVNFRLYRHAGDRKPYATYYYALGHDTEPDCQ